MSASGLMRLRRAQHRPAATEVKPVSRRAAIAVFRRDTATWAGLVPAVAAVVHDVGLLPVQGVERVQKGRRTPFADTL